MKKFKALTETQIIDNLKASSDAAQGILDTMQDILASAIFHAYRTGQLHIANRVINTINANNAFMNDTKKAVAAFLENFLPFARKAKEGENPDFPLLMKKGGGLFSEYEADQAVAKLPLFYKWKKDRKPAETKKFNAESQITSLINRSLKAEVDGKNSMILASLQSFLPLILEGKLLNEVVAATEVAATEVAATEVAATEVAATEVAEENIIKSVTSKTPVKRAPAKRAPAKRAADKKAA